MTIHVSPNRLAQPAGCAATTAAATATLLPGGEALLLVDGTGEAVPELGQLTCSGGIFGWRAKVWDRGADEGRGWYALAVAESLPRHDALLFDASGARCWQLEIAPRIWSSAGGLAARARAIGADLCEIFRHLAELLARAAPADGPQSRLLAAFVADYLEAVADRAGFVEVLAEPLTGGLFLQGWAQGLDDGPLHWLAPGETAELTAAAFARPDLLDPARGLCLFHKGLAAETVARHRGGYVEQGGRILRLDLVASAGPALRGAEATRHVAQMIPRLVAAEPRAMSGFRRICRPRYAGEDTLSGTALPVAVGFDHLLKAPDGSLLVAGWMLDPERRVGMALIKSLQNRYGRISETWVRLPRPDLGTAFAADPRFAGRLDPQEAMHGFIARVPPAPETADDADLYLELVLDDDSCLFQPLRPTPVAGAERVARILSALSPAEPELGRIIDDHLAPFLARLDPQPSVHRAAAARPIPLGRPREPAPVEALIPCQGLDALQPVFALLAGTPEAGAMDLTLIAPRAAVEELLVPLEQAFRFYGLSGRVVIAPDRAPRTAWLDAALPFGTAPHVLLWSPSALPRTPGWLARLLAEAGEVQAPGLISPALTYEDGSIRFGPPARGADPLGYGADWLRRGRPAAMPAGAAEIALIDRNRLLAAGGFAGQMLGDAHAHLDLAARLAAAGAGVWCSGAVEFWMLDDPAADPDTPMSRILNRVDARLLALRGGPVSEELLR